MGVRLVQFNRGIFFFYDRNDGETPVSLKWGVCGVVERRIRVHEPNRYFSMRSRND